MAHAEAIIRTAAYHRKSNCDSVISFRPSEHDNVRTSLSTSFKRAPSIGLGSLDQLPLELLNCVLLQLDIRTLFRFRQANLVSRHIVDALKEYQAAVSYGLNCICASLRTGTAVNVQLSNFYDLLCSRECVSCGELGGFVFLPSWKRYCFRCINRDNSLKMQSFTAIQKRFKFPRQQLERLTLLKTLPGNYTFGQVKYKTRVTIVQTLEAISIARDRPEIKDEGYGVYDVRSWKYRLMACCSLPYYDRCKGEAEYALHCAGCELAFGRYHVTLWPDSFDELYEAREKVYDTAGFLAHFEGCEDAQLLWETSKEGTVEPPRLPRRAMKSEQCACHPT